MNEPYRLRYVNQIVGGFVLAVLLTLITSIVWLMASQGVFSNELTYFVIIDQNKIDGLQKNAEVMILGERAGKVDSIEYTSPRSDKIRITMTIGEEFGDKIFRNTKVLLERKFGVGAPILVLQRPSVNDQEKKEAGISDDQWLASLSRGGELRRFDPQKDQLKEMSASVKSVDESISTAQKDMSPALAEVKTAAETAKPAFEATETASREFAKTNKQMRPLFKETLEHIDHATMTIENRIVRLSKQLDYLTGKEFPETLSDVRGSTDKVDKAAASLKTTSDNLDSNLVVTLEKLNQAADEIKALAEETRDIVKVVRKEANELPGTVTNVNDTVHDAQNMVDEIRNHPLIRNYGDRKAYSSQVSPSGIRGGLPR